MPGQRIGSTIAAVFGLIYVFVNTMALPGMWEWLLRGLAVAVFAVVLITVVRTPRCAGTAEYNSGPSGRSAQAVFGRAYWCVLAVEVVALFGGAQSLSGPLHAPQAGVAWVSLVVGTHFFALAVIFTQPFFHLLGAAITACGAVGVVLALTGAGTAIIGLVAGVAPGALLLGFGWWGALRKVDQSLVVDPEEVQP